MAFDHQSTNRIESNRSEASHTRWPRVFAGNEWFHDSIGKPPDLFAGDPFPCHLRAVLSVR
jgi:hypothetical protein